MLRWDPHSPNDYAWSGHWSYSAFTSLRKPKSGSPQPWLPFPAFSWLDCRWVIRLDPHEET